jgi:hypothetical protein
MGRFSEVTKILDDAVGNQDIGAHGRFWLGKTRDQFVNMNVLGEQLLVVGDGTNSNLVKALRGEAPFGADLPTPPSGAIYRRMPAGRTPVADGLVAVIQSWIDDGCPDDAPLAAKAN